MNNDLSGHTPMEGQTPFIPILTGARLCGQRQPQWLRSFLRVFACCGWSCGHSRAPVVFREIASPLCHLALTLVLFTGCASKTTCCAWSMREQVRNRLTEILHAAETKDLARLDGYHWYGPHFTKFAGTGPRQDAETARAGEHKGLSALAGLKLRADDLQIDVFADTAVATFTMVATIQTSAEAITKRERGTLVFVWHEGSWKIVHEHFSPTE